MGALCFIIDFGLLYILVEYARCHYLLAAAISFVVSVVVNYWMSVKYVFYVNHNSNKVKEFIWFVVFSVIGLLMTEILMKLGVGSLNWNYMVVKIIATTIVMIYNFITRKIFLEKGQKQ